VQKSYRSPSIGHARWLAARNSLQGHPYRGTQASPYYPLTRAASVGERGHGGLARRLVAVRRLAVVVVAKGQCPHPRRAYRCGVPLEDAADDNAVVQHVEIVIVLLAGWAARRSALEDHRHRSRFSYFA